MPFSPVSRHGASARTAELLHSLDLQIQRALKSADSGQVHDLRVATRRFAQALYVFGSADSRATKVRRELKPLMNAAGDVRDFDIAIKMIAKDNAAGDAKIVAAIEQERAKAQSRLSAELQKIAGRESITRWRKQISRNPETGGADHAILLAARLFFSRGETAGKAKSPPRALHRLRIAAKKLRYTLELGPGVMSRNQLEKIEQLQADLGKIHDLDAVRELLKEYPGSKKLRGSMRKEQRTLTREFHKFWSSEFDGKKQRRAWMSRIEKFAASLQPAERKPVQRAAPARRAA